MRHEPGHRFQTVPKPRFAGKRQSSSTSDGLPLDLGFLREVGVSRFVLDEARREAQRLNLHAVDVLLASGAVSAVLYYKSLADRLGVPFVDGPALLSFDGDPEATILRGFARRHDTSRGCLVAPTGPMIVRLLTAKTRGLAMPTIALVTPAHLSALVRRQAGVAIGHRASNALLERDPALSAKAITEAARRWQTLALVAGLAAAVGFMAPRTVTTILNLLFFVAISFRLLVCANAFRSAPAMAEPVADARLPLYSVLVPLYEEAGMIPSLIRHLDALDYPTSKLQILILIETDDRATLDALRRERLAPRYEIVVIPDGRPRTKPRALNVGLALSRGHITTVFDAEDAPAPDQLRKAAAVFRDGPPDLACLQAKLVVSNAEDGILARLFAIEYAALFDVYNVGVASSGLPMALGGTSNHFRTCFLRRAGGWDAWNVAEDADLGFRLARLGYRVGMLESTTRERALTDFEGWLKQRRRWTKGWIQTILVLAFYPRRTLRDFGPMRAGALLLMATSLILGPLLSPILLPATLWDCMTRGVPDPHDWPDLITGTLWFSVLFLGLVAPVFQAHAGIRARGLWRWLLTLPLVIPYQVPIAMAAWMGAYDLVKRPFHWHKTQHVARPREAAEGEKKAPRKALFGARILQIYALRALRAAYFASRAALRAASSATTRDARANSAAASAAFASSAATRSASR